MTSSDTAVQGDDLVPGHGDRSYGVSHYDLDLTYRHVGNHLSGTATLDVVVHAPTNVLTLDLYALRVSEVRVNGVAPGAILWPDGDEHFAPTERDRILAQTPLRRIGNPEDVAGAVKYLLFDAPFVTGQILSVDGGRALRM